MEKRSLWMLAVVAAIVALLAMPFILNGTLDHSFHARYKKVSVGMTLAEVEVVLGPGKEIKPDEVPQYVAPKPGVKIPRDPPGAPPRTARNYRTEHQPVMPGERFWQWESDSDEAIIGFKDGRVIDKYYWYPSL